MNIEQTQEYKRLCEVYGVEAERFALKDKEDNCLLEGEFFYPSFTPQKQLELIKLVTTNEIGEPYKSLSIDKDELDEYWYFTLSQENKDNININRDSFKEALIELLIALKDVLDHTKVKETLEG